MLNIIHNSKIIKKNNNKNNRNDKMKQNYQEEEEITRKKISDHCSFKKYIKVQITIYYYKNCRNYHCI